jgi:hypothetical protein
VTSQEVLGSVELVCLAMLSTETVVSTFSSSNYWHTSPNNDKLSIDTCPVTPNSLISLDYLFFFVAFAFYLHKILDRSGSE